jgi:hypothetical protein
VLNALPPLPPIYPSSKTISSLSLISLSLVIDYVNTLNYPGKLIDRSRSLTELSIMNRYPEVSKRKVKFFASENMGTFFCSSKTIYRSKPEHPRDQASSA